jgi:cytochrome c peroxidase
MPLRVPYVDPVHLYIHLLEERTMKSLKLLQWMGTGAACLVVVMFLAGCSPDRPTTPSSKGVQEGKGKPGGKMKRDRAKTEEAKADATEEATKAEPELPPIEPAAEPAKEPAAEPAKEPMAEPAAEPAPAPPAEPAPTPEPAAEPAGDQPMPPDLAAPKPAADATAPAPAPDAPPTPTPPPAEPTPLQVAVPAGLPALPIPADNPMTAEKVELGKLLYFDKRLSRDGTISCATCHDPTMAWAEHEPTSTGVDGQVGGANAPTVINAAYATEQFWDGRAPKLEDQALGPIENPIEMAHQLTELVPQLNAIPEYRERFQTVFGTDVTSDGIAKAIAAFERTVLSGNSPYDKFQAGDTSAMTEAQQRGWKVFDDLGCTACHAPPMFSNYKYFNAGIGMAKDPPDKGRMAVTGDEGDLGKIRVPSLREVANTAPYFHDGSVATLEEAVAVMVGGGIDNPKLSPVLKGIGGKTVSDQEKADLVEFLKALSGEYPVIEPPALPQ